MVDLIQKEIYVSKIFWTYPKPTASNQPTLFTNRPRGKNVSNDNNMKGRPDLFAAKRPRCTVTTSMNNSQ